METLASNALHLARNVQALQLLAWNATMLT